MFLFYGANYCNGPFLYFRGKMEFVRDLTLNQKALLTAASMLLSVPIAKVTMKTIESWLMASLPSMPEWLQRKLIQSHLKWWSGRLEAGGDAEKQHHYREKMIKVSLSQKSRV